MRTLFEARYMGDGIYRIEGQGAVGMYLVIGGEKAALLDAGVGIGDLHGFVQTLTDKPVEVYLTHGHVDHAGGIYSFDKVYLNPADRQLMAQHTLRRERLAYANLIKSAIPGHDLWTEDDLAEVWDIPTLDVFPGDRIDLGGRILDVVDFKGHTAGSVGYYDGTTRTLFCGDGCNNSTFMFLPEALSIAEYLETLLQLKREWGPQIDKYVICHDYDYVPADCVDQVIDCCRRILSGTDDRAPFQHPNPSFSAYPARWASDGGADRKDGKFGNIVYDYTRL